MLLAVQKSLAETMKGCKSAMLKAKSDGQSKPLAKTRSCRPSGTRASVRTSCSRSRSMCISNACLGWFERKKNICEMCTVSADGRLWTGA